MMVQIGKPNMYNNVICTAFFFMIKMLYILNRYCSDKNIRCVWNLKTTLNSAKQIHVHVSIKAKNVVLTVSSAD